MRWRRVFPGNEDQVRLVRRLISELLAEHPCRDDVVLCAAELSTNAIRFTASGRGGTFAVELSWAGATTRLAVADQGGPNLPARRANNPGKLAENGRGLNLVARLSTAFGVEGDHRGRVVWAQFRELTAATPGSSSQPLRPHPGTSQDAAILARRYAGWHTWFGPWTRQWWALPRHRAGRAVLITEPTAAALARRLDALQADGHQDGRETIARSWT